ncbi:MAG: phenylalanine--tRNA ligase subunit alpha [candidate division Zixibacteria bacterium]|nr:phenylalanine--tRNA ligase subunit alpha [candidate division Zixibacteria bacterium]
MSLSDEVNTLEAQALERIGTAGSLESLKELEIRYLGRKGELTEILKSLKDLSVEEKKTTGAKANAVRLLLAEKIAEASAQFETKTSDSSFDPTLPGTGQKIGAIHVVNQVMGEICRTFYGMGFEIAHGPHIETDYYNFEALNFPPDHPARDMQDTFFVDGGRLLRTHTTPVQARELERRKDLKPPIKIITPGKTFRNEAVSTRAHVSFHQVDGFLVDEGVSMADLKGALVAFCHSFFGEKLKLKFRPSYFPFTEPSAEVDISCFLCSGKGCQLCKYSGWLEILGCGMIHPNVLERAGYDSEKYTGYAFGMGVERVAMLKYKINDIRLFFNNNVRFLQQFK